MILLGLGTARAECNWHAAKDSWSGKDKLQHFGLSIPLGMLGTHMARNSSNPVLYGTLIGTAPGLVKELLDARCQGSGFSYKDLTADVLGSLSGAYLGNMYITYQNKGEKQLTVGYRTSF